MEKGDLSPSRCHLQYEVGCDESTHGRSSATLLCVCSLVSLPLRWHLTRTLGGTVSTLYTLCSSTMQFNKEITLETQAQQRAQMKGLGSI